jgi:malonyl CoA-acyl carrier protein transacylase
MTVFLFPGQGSQARGMGRDLFDRLPEFTDIEPEIDRLLGFSVRSTCLQNEGDRLQQTRFTQPCLYLVNSLHYFAALREFGPPDAVAGHSLGEYNALLAAGAFDLLTGLRLVQRRAALMGDCGSGGMMAVLGLDGAAILPALTAAGLQAIDIANRNSPSQTVLSGPVEGLTRAAAVLQQAGAQACVRLAVSGAFHSRYMSGAARSFSESVAHVTFARLRIPVIANATGRPYPESDSRLIGDLLVSQITQTVQWNGGIRYLIERGARSFREVGPGSVLTRLLTTDAGTRGLTIHGRAPRPV